jgi:hypothetical protein
MAWFSIDATGEPPRRGTLVCDATAAAGPAWAGPLLSVLEAFAEGPPAGHPEVVFLGDRVAVPLAEAMRRAADPGRVARELGRGPVLGPWAAWADPRPTVVVLLPATQLLDVDDYETPAWRPHLRLYRVLGGPAQAAVPDFGPADLDAVIEFLTDAPVKLVVGGPGAVLDWSPEAVAADWGEVSWAAPPWPPAGGPVLVEYDHPDGTPPAATLTRRSGATHPCRVSPAGRPTAPELPVPLPPAAVTLCTLWGRGTPWACDWCHASHAPGVAACVAGGGSLLPALTAGRLWSVRARPGSRVAVPCPRGRVVAADGSVLRLGPAGVECRRPDGTVDLLHALFQANCDGGFVVLS